MGWAEEGGGRGLEGVGESISKSKQPLWTSGLIKVYSDGSALNLMSRAEFCRV